MQEIINSPFFGLVLSLIAFQIGLFLNKILKTPIANPLLIAIVLVIIFLKTFDIPLESYNVGGNYIALFLVPSTISLSVMIYKNFSVLVKNFIPIIAGAFVGSLVSIISIILISNYLNLDAELTNSLVSKSVTTPIAIEITNNLNGIPAITVAMVVITGILAAVFSPTLIKVLRLKNKVATGVAIGTSSHALGTTKAVEIGEIEGTMSGIAIGIAGIITVFISMFL